MRRKRERPDEDRKGGAGEDLELDSGYSKLMRDLGVKHKENAISSEEEDEEEEEEFDEDEQDEEEEREEDDTRVQFGVREGEQEDLPQEDEQDEELVGDPEKELVVEELLPDDPFVKHYAREYEEGELPRMSSQPIKYERVSKGKVELPSGIEASLVSSCKLVEGDAARFLKPAVMAQVGVLPDSLFCRDLLRCLVSYCDVMLPGIVGAASRAQVRSVYATHLVSHILKQQERVWQGNAELRARAREEARDQGFSRCRALVLLPSCGDAYDFVCRMLDANPRRGVPVEGLEAFQDYCASDSAPPKRRPKDHIERFSINFNDAFQFGIRFNYDNVRIGSAFASSDVIVASPLRLRATLGDEKHSQTREILSSIELLYLDSTEMLQMQNWDHVNVILKAMNKIPRQLGKTDFSRLQAHFVNGESKYLRQTVVAGEVLTPDTNALFQRMCKVPRKAFFSPIYKGELTKMQGNLHLLLQKVPFSSLEEAANERIKFFCDKLLPTLLKRKGVLVYVPTYFDFLRIRQHLKEINVEFCHLCEYTKKKSLTLDRIDFFEERAPIMLYTERLHFYWRYRIRGVKTVVFFGLPMLPRFFSEVMTFIPEAQREKGQVIVLYNSLDKFALERVMGEKRAGQVLDSPKDTHMLIL